MKWRIRREKKTVTDEYIGLRLENTEMKKMLDNKFNKDK